MTHHLLTPTLAVILAHYYHRCLAGWKGPNCEECEVDPDCYQGTCVRPYDCICQPGWSGPFCRKKLYCFFNQPCQHNSTCKDTELGGHTCSCSPGYTGRQCETVIPSCDVDPCQNRGTCKPDAGPDVFSCDCAPGFVGPRCETAVWI